ncbi:hypothetical protein MSAN_02030400 [Mycena sanguinolenta]|uniref:Uncharacterized protein n=1 Tax=Mycena sanguinolenta TaxID=230812 RepID=A0A8H6XJQ5_9AGAR|nr:hypothetical protein MSAN_02030400 [Mycena sanguinolenta]
MGFEHFHVSKAGAAFHHGSSSKAKRDSSTPDPSCATGAFYVAPALGATVDTSSPLAVSWAPQLSCLQPAPSNVDILLYGLGDNTPPSWWNSTSSKQLQLMILASGTPSFLSTLPAGPVFTATYSSSSGVSATVAADTALPTSGTITYVSGAPLGGASTHKLSAGKKAAAIKRTRGQAKRSAWSETLDKRMSMISADWKSITPGGAKEAVRQSIAASRPSNASFSYGAGAIKTGAVEGEPVVMGEKTRGGSIEISEKDLPRTTLGAGVGVGVGARRPRTHANPPDRGSRAVSFADSAHPRPSTGSRPYSRGSRAFHTASYAADDDEEGVPAMPPVPALPSPSRAGAFGAIERLSSEKTSPTAATGNGVYGNTAAWSSGERVEGVDGGYGAQSVSPTGRVHTINYPAGMMNTSSAYDVNGNDDHFAYGTPSAADASYFSPITPTPHATTFAQRQSTFDQVYAQDPSADSAYAVNTFSSFPSSGYSSTAVSSPDLSGTTSPRQTAGPLTLTPEDIRRRMTMQNGQEGWRQSVDEVFGALSLMRTGSTSGSNTNANEDDDGDEYLFAPSQSETVFAYPGTPAPGSGFGKWAVARRALPPHTPRPPPPAFTTPAVVSTPTTASSTSPFAMPMQPPTMSPDAMLRAYAAKHASVTPSLSRKATAEVVGSLKDTGMRVLYKPEDDANPARAASPGLIRAGPGARISR